MSKTSKEREEQIFFMALLFKLWEEWTDTLPNLTPEQRAEQDEHMDYFMAKTGAKEKSPAYLMYSAFIGGVGKGIELVEKMDQKSQEG